MRVFVYEFVTGGGWYDVDPSRPPDGSLLAEGRAMVEAVARDFLEIKGVEVAALRDVRLSFQPSASKNCLTKVASRSEGEAKFLEQAAVSDYTLIIAPQFAGHLWRRTFAVERLGVKLLSPNSEFVAIASDKWRTFQYLRANNFQTPDTVLVTRDEPQLPDWPFPLVLKPVDGCGSRGVQLMSSRHQEIDWSNISGRAIVQPLCEGAAASISYLQSERCFYGLPFCRQFLAKEGFDYVGGECPLTVNLGWRTGGAVGGFPVLPASRGYFGIDLILGEAEDGSQDYVIEIKPRLTTSYVGLRALSNTNLAQAMLDVAEGREPQFDWKPGRVHWSADGVVEYFA